MRSSGGFRRLIISRGVMKLLGKTVSIRDLNRCKTGVG